MLAEKMETPETYHPFYYELQTLIAKVKELHSRLNTLAYDVVQGEAYVTLARGVAEAYRYADEIEQQALAAREKFRAVPRSALLTNQTLSFFVKEIMDMKMALDDARLAVEHNADYEPLCRLILSASTTMQAVELHANTIKIRALPAGGLPSDAESRPLIS
jgi:hypothetical protein